jgi:hypothetical protein
MTHTKLLIAASMIFTFFLVVWGMTGDCPYAPEGDEMYCVGPALHMAQQNSLNPEWLAHPASTTIYPLFLYYHFLNAAFFHGTLFGGNQNLENVTYDHIWLICYLPRFVNVFFLVACMPFVYLIARDIFSRRAGLIALCFFSISPLLVVYTQVIRSECPALFFSMVALYCSLRYFREPVIKWQLFAAAAIGLGASSRYTMFALLPVLLAVDALLVWQNRTSENRNKYIAHAVSGTALAFVTFALTTPFLFLDFEVFKRDMLYEKAAHGLGCDGLSTFGNFQFYLDEAIPREFGFISSILACFGVLIALVKRNFPSFFLFLYAIAILAGTSLHPFHSDRWLVSIIPILAIFAAGTIATVSTLVELRLAKVSKIAASIMVVALILLTLLRLEYDQFITICVRNTGKIHVSTEPLFYKWVFENIPHGTHICFVGVWSGGHRELYNIKDVLWDPNYFDQTFGKGNYRSPMDFYNEGYKYFVWTDIQSPAYLAEPNHYPRECRFYKELLDHVELVKEIAPEQISVGGLYNIKQRGPTLRLYKFIPNPNFNAK